MSYPPFDRMQEGPIPVPHGNAVPHKQDERWKYRLAAAITALLLLLLLLLLLFNVKSSGMGQTGSNPGGQTAGAAEGTENAAADRAGANEPESGAEEETNEPAGQPAAGEPDSNASNDTKEGTAPPVMATEPPRDIAIDELLRRISAEPDEDNFPANEERAKERTGGDAIVKGDATVNFFGATGKGSKFVFVFDRSGSMRGRPLESVKRELIKSLEPLKSNHSFNIIAYDSRYDMWRDRLISATRENKADAVRFVEGTVDRGGTQPREPLLTAISQKPEVIFFMTDGQFSLDLDEIGGKARGVIINVVQFSEGGPLAILQELANRTGGEFMLIKVQGISDAL